MSGAASRAKGRRGQQDALTRTQLDQMLSYANQAYVDGWYYGNREQFNMRHKRIMEWLQEQIDAQSRPS